jgi:hypothetical protein
VAELDWFLKDQADLGSNALMRSKTGLKSPQADSPSPNYKNFPKNFLSKTSKISLPAPSPKTLIFHLTPEADNLSVEFLS